MSYPNAEQDAVLRQLHGTLLVLAPAGTGKTRVMADRLARVIADGIPAADTLAVTFTNRAAEEMRRAVARSCGDHVRDCRIQTFHGLCAWILRTEARALGLPSDFVIYDEQDSIDLLRACLGDRDQRPDEAYWMLSQLKSECPAERLTLGEVPNLGAGSLSAVFRDYHQRLAERHALDFSDLVYRVRAMFRHLEEKRRRWACRFRWIQIDEVQDTHLSEYEVIRVLASPPADIAFFGDLDQTIYEWRGSKPDEVLQQLDADFGPVSRLSLVYNYRSTKALLRVADRHAATFNQRRTATTPAPDLPAGEAPVIHRADDPDSEAAWIAKQVKGLLPQQSAVRIGILARTHKRTLAVSAALAAAEVPHVTVEQFEFFRRQEVKDLLARLRLTLNPSDSGSLLRLTQRPASGIGPATLRQIWQAGQDCGLRITDLVRTREGETDGGAAEPFADLLTALDRGTVVVFDVETTGLSPASDEVIDLGAVKLVRGRAVARFEALLRPSRPPGESVLVHGIDEATLARDGREPAEVLRGFADFVGDALVVGHNVGFDVAMVRAHAGRLGIPLPLPRWDDTLDLARRFLALERFDLATVCAHFQTQARPSHRALADAEATAEVLGRIHPGLVAGAAGRRDLTSKHRAAFQPIQRHLATWRALAGKERPGELCRIILRESGLADHYAGDPKRLGNLARLVQYFEQNDDPLRPPAEALDELARRVALAKNVDHLDPGEERIPVITVHQSKGLEFDHVFIAGMAEDEFPGYHAKREGKVEEEKRLFYVALTRAKKRLSISCHATNEFGYRKAPSSFLTGLRA